MNNQPLQSSVTKRLPANVWKFYLYKLLLGLGFGLAIPVAVLYFQERGISLFGYMILMTVLNFSTLIFEVPTGVVADKFSRKWSICLGTALMAMAAVAMLTTVNFVLLVLGFFCWGLGRSLVSGADSALLYDSLQAEKMEERFQPIIGNAISIGLAATVVGTLVGGYLITSFSLSAPMWGWLALTLVVVFLTATFTEPPILKSALDKVEALTFRGRVSDYVDHLRASFHLVSRNREVLALILISLVLVRLWSDTERPFSQPHLTSFGYTPAQISYLHTLFYLIAALLAKFSHKIIAWKGGSEGGAFLAIGLVGTLAILLIVNAGNGLMAVVGLSAVYVVHGLSQPFIHNSLNQRVTSEKRAACLSIANMGNSILGVFLGPLFGYLAVALSLRASLLVFQWTLIPLLLVALLWGWRVLGAKQQRVMAMVQR